MSVIRVSAVFSLPLPRTRVLRRREAQQTDWTVSAIVDTASTRTMLPLTCAEQMGVTQLTDGVIPTAYGEHEVLGQYGRVVVSLPDFGVRAEVEAFFANEGTEVLIGTDFLAAIGASLNIGRRRVRFVRSNPDDASDGDFITALWRYSDDDLE